MVHIDTLREVISKAFPKSPKPDTYRTLDEGNANDNTHLITIHKVSNTKIAVKASTRETSGAEGEELAYKVSQLLGLGVVTPAKIMGNGKEFGWNFDTGIAVIKWAPEAVTLDMLYDADIDTENGDFAISLGYIAFFCWLLNIGDRHDGNAVISNNRIYCIDNEDVLDHYFHDAFAYIFPGMPSLDNSGVLLCHMAFNEAMWRFQQVHVELANLIFSYDYFLKANIGHWDNWRDAQNRFAEKMEGYIK